MTCCVLGGRSITGQVDNLRAGFASLGHTHIDDPLHPDVEFVFIGNPPFDKYLDIAKHKKTIFNVLDIPFHVPEVQSIIDTLTVALPRAAKVTAISKATQHNLKECCNVDAEVIYYPMNPVKHTGLKKYPFRAMMAGRLRDPNKYTAVAVQALTRAGIKEDEVAMVGPEYPGWGVNMGEVSTEVLEDLYNSVDYLICTTKNTGAELSPIESACSGSIPIVLPHLETFDEFWKNSPLGAHYRQLTSVNRITELILAIDGNLMWKQEIKQDILGYATLAFRPKFEAKRVAAQIIDVFESI